MSSEYAAVLIGQDTYIVKRHSDGYYESHLAIERVPEGFYARPRAVRAAAVARALNRYEVYKRAEARKKAARKKAQEIA